MLKVTTSDLRIGNWLYYTEDSRFPMKVCAVGKDRVQMDFEGNEGDCFENNGDEIYPIPLNIDIIERVCRKDYGYKHDYKDDIKKGYSIEIGRGKYIEIGTSTKDGIFCAYPTTNGDEYTIGADIHNVHELQNLYHALTGKELNIKREWL